MKPTRSRFGAYIRAARLGYHYVRAIDAHVRISGDGPWLVEVARAGCCDDLCKLRGNHVVWWEPPLPGDGEWERLCEMSPALAALSIADIPTRLFVGEDGTRIGSRDVKSRAARAAEEGSESDGE